MATGPRPSAFIAGRYAVVARIGGGANGDVYEVHDTHQDERVALKLLAAGPHGIWAEAAILTGLRDEHILAVRNADIYLGQPYLVTELALHGTLQSVTPAHGVAPDAAVAWMRQVCRGAARTHDAALLHTDIKPPNIFLDDKGRALLGDFGLACLPDPNTGEGHAAGTAETMAPEVAAAHVGLPNGHGSTVTSDVYSLAASLYFLLAGRYAHRRNPAIDPHGLDCMKAVAAGAGPRLTDVAPHVPQGLCARVEHGMARDRLQRPTSSSHFAAMLGDWTRPQRAWRRTDEHGSAHAGCWRGTKPRAAELVCCAVAATSGFEIETRSPSGNRVAAGCTTARNQRELPRALRRAFRDTQ